MNKRRIEIDDNDAYDIITALGMRICQIETGTTTMRAIDAKEFNKARKSNVRSLLTSNSQKKIEINALSREQRDSINRMEDLIERLRKK